MHMFDPVVSKTTDEARKARGSVPNRFDRETDDHPPPVGGNGVGNKGKGKMA